MNTLPRHRKTIDIWLVSITLCLLAGCGGEAKPAASQVDETQRLISLAPAITQMLADLGEGGHVVGVGMHDAAVGDAETGVAGDVPVVGTYTQPDVEAVLAARPTHVLMMTGKEGVPDRLREAAEAGAFEIAVFDMPATEAEVWRVTREVGEAVGREAEAERVVTEAQRRLAAVEEEAAAGEIAKWPRVLPLIALDPAMAVGPRTMLGRLVTLAGGQHVLNDFNNDDAAATLGPSLDAPTLDREAIARLRPDIILLLMPGAPPLAPADDPLADPRLSPLRGIPVPAVEHARIHLIHDPRVLLPSTNIAHTAELIRRAIADHPHP